jgi:hypothetical protein
MKGKHFVSLLYRLRGGEAEKRRSEPDPYGLKKSPRTIIKNASPVCSSIKILSFDTNISPLSLSAAVSTSLNTIRPEEHSGRFLDIQGDKTFVSCPRSPLTLHDQNSDAIEMGVVKCMAFSEPYYSICALKIECSQY